MLEYLASKGFVQDNWLKTLTKRLLNKNPRLRPLFGVHCAKLGHSGASLK